MPGKALSSPSPEGFNQSGIKEKQGGGVGSWTIQISAFRLDSLRTYHPSRAVWRLCCSVVKPRAGLIQIPAQLLTGLGGSCCVYPPNILLFLTKPQFCMALMERWQRGIYPRPRADPGSSKPIMANPSPSPMTEVGMGL